MKCYEYARGASELGEFVEVTIEADPRTLRQLAAFLNACADGMTQAGERWDHEHFKDSSFSDLPDSAPDLIVARSL